MPIAHPLFELSLRALAAALRNGELRGEDVVERYRARIDAVNPQLHALVRHAADAQERARAADLARSRGEPCGPLHGVPITVKDWIEVEGMVCDSGFVERRDYLPKRDATVITRLRAAGAIVLGKSRTGSGPSALHPACGNPLDPARTPGASSSGDAALVAARASPLGIGSDSGGSVRWPAHCCGVAGLKPTYGRVPNTGHFPPIGALADPRTVIGPLARHVDDLRIAFELIAGSDGIDTAALPMPLAIDDPKRDGPWRIAWFDGWDGEQQGWGSHADATRHAITTDNTGGLALCNAVAALRDAGHTLVEELPPRIVEARAITHAYWARPESISLRSWRPSGASRLTADEIEESLFAWERLRREMLGFMQNFDLILCPAAPRIAPLQGDERIDDYAFMLPFSLTGQPVACLPTAIGSEGMPASVQVIAPLFLEQRALAAAEAIEQRCGAWPALR